MVSNYLYCSEIDDRTITQALTKEATIKTRVFRTLQEILNSFLIPAQLLMLYWSSTRKTGVQIAPSRFKTEHNSHLK